MKNTKLSKFFDLLWGEFKSALQAILIFLLGCLFFVGICFLIGFPMVYFGFDITRDDTSIYQKYFGMGFITIVVSTCAIAFPSYTIISFYRWIKNLWENA